MSVIGLSKSKNMVLLWETKLCFVLQNQSICQKHLLVYDKDYNDETECMLQDPLLSSSEKFDVSTTIFTL